MSFIGKRIQQVSGSIIGRKGTVEEEMTDENGNVHVRTKEDGIWCPVRFVTVLSPKYTVVGGSPYKNMFTGLHVVGTAENEEDVRKLCHTNYDACGGLLLVLDNETCKEAIIP